jgi:hypothetical protein
MHGAVRTQGTGVVLTTSSPASTEFTSTWYHWYLTLPTLSHGLQMEELQGFVSVPWQAVLGVHLFVQFDAAYVYLTHSAAASVPTRRSPIATEYRLMIHLQWLEEEHETHQTSVGALQHCQKATTPRGAHSPRIRSPSRAFQKGSAP